MLPLIKHHFLTEQLTDCDFHVGQTEELRKSEEWLFPIMGNWRWPEKVNYCWQFPLSIEWPPAHYYTDADGTAPDFYLTNVPLINYRTTLEETAC